MPIVRLLREASLPGATVFQANPLRAVNLEGHIPQDKIEEIQRRADIVELVSEYVTLKKAGKDFWGLCPFHKEKTPSFKVSRDKQMYYCFGCAEGGHVFTFLMKVSNMTFPEAARHLARKTGIVIPERAMSDQERRQYGLREQIYRANEAATVFFTGSLFSAAGLEAREYLKKRGIREDVVREFRLGYADRGGRTLKGFFEKKSVPLEVACQAGLLVAKTEENGENRRDVYDRFRGRLIFPIEDAGGRVMAFGGRVIGQGEPKYLNSPETPVFSKGRNLYGLNRTKEGIRKSGYAILVEGYFDLISLWNAGLTNVLASLGTALTAEQVELMRRYTEQVAILFDGDEAGKKALKRSLPLFLAAGLQARAVVLPEKNDPDDYVRRYGKESLEELIAGAPTLVDYYIDDIMGDQGTLEGKQNAVKEALLFLSTLDDAIVRNLFLKRIADKTGIDQELLKKEMSRPRKTSAGPGPQRNTGESTLRALDKVEFSLILFLLQHPESIAKVGETGVLDYFTDNELRDLAQTIIAKGLVEGVADPGASFYLDCLDDGPLKGLIVKSLLEGWTDDERVCERYFTDMVKQIKRKCLKRRSKALTIELGKAQEKGDSEWQNRLSLEKTKLVEEEKLL